MKVLVIDNSPGMGGSIFTAVAILNGLIQFGEPAALAASRPDLYRPLLNEAVRFLEIGWNGFRNVFDPSHGLFGGKIPGVSQALALRRFSKKLSPEIEKTIKIFSPDLVVINNLNLPNLPVLEAAKHRRLPVVLHAQMIRAFGRREGRMAAKADQIVCVSEAVRECLMEQMFLDPQRVSVITPGVDPSRFPTERNPAARRSFGLPESVPIACLVGRLSRWKGHHVAIRAWEIVHHEFPQAILAIAGAGEEDYMAECRALATQLGLSEAVKFIGHQTDVPRVLAAGDLLLHSSCYAHYRQGPVEALGMVVLEAMAARLPVIATAAGGVREIVEDGVTGKLVPPGDPQAIAEAIINYFRDPAAGLAAGGRGRRRVTENFTTQIMVEKWYDILKQ